MKTEEEIINRMDGLNNSALVFKNAQKGSIGYRIAKNAIKELKILAWVIDE